MIVPVSAGGAMDTLARIVGQGMGTALGQPVVIENVTGASGSIGVGRVARAAPDGYTLSYAAFATHVVSPATMSLPYDVIARFRAGRADLGDAVADRRQEGSAGERPQGPDRLA